MLCVQLCTDVITVLMDNVCVYLFVCHLTDLCNNWCIYVNIHFLVFWCYVCNNYYTVALPEANNVTMHGEDSALGGTNSIKYPCMHKCSSELFPTKWWCLYGYALALSGNQGISLYFPINVRGNQCCMHLMFSFWWVLDSLLIKHASQLVDFWPWLQVVKHNWEAPCSDS